MTIEKPGDIHKKEINTDTGASQEQRLKEASNLSNYPGLCKSVDNRLSLGTSLLNLALGGLGGRGSAGISIVVVR